jgi:predicted MPP superfamily phosphohydrolase
MRTMQSPKQPSRRHSKWRLAFFTACRNLTRALGGRRFYRWSALRTERLVLREETLCAPELPVQLEGFTVLHLSDIHAGPFLSGGDLAHLHDLLDGRIPDILVVTGDFITDSYKDALPVIPELGLLKTRLGGWAVFGNHDYRHHKHTLLRDRLAEYGIRCLQDEGERVADLPLWISGLNDLEETPRPDPTQARAKMAPGDVEIMLCHNPLGAKSLAQKECIAILSGHTHGRQIDLPWLRDLGPAHPGLSVSLGATTLIVNRGLGVVGVPVRVRAPAEMVWIELRRGHASEGRRTRIRRGSGS